MHFPRNRRTVFIAATMGLASAVLSVVFFIFAVASRENGVSLAQEPEPTGILYPQDSESREIRSLDGIWNFRLAPRFQPELGFQQQWYSQPLDQTGDVELMPVPSSYNDITQSKEIRDHIGWVWYDRPFRVPRQWEDRRVFVRFGAANYHAIVYVNGQKVVEHAGGALPFLAELKTELKFTEENLITVAINNTLTRQTLPQGSVVWQGSARYPEGYFTLNYDFDFFNYAGIHRSVFLYTTPKTFIDDIDVTSAVNGTTGIVSYSVKAFEEALNTVRSKARAVSVTVELHDRDGNVVGSGAGASGEIAVSNAKLWWPVTMVQNDRDAAYLYTLVVSTVDTATSQIDVYRLKVGIRTVSWNHKQFFINNKPFYFRGFGRHEDFDVRGKGIDNVMIVKDHNLVKWIGANSYRTSHYPYSEEIMDLTDRLGIVIIDEVPAVSIDGFSAGLLVNHKQQLKELIQRDKNRASVVMWSVSNEPRSNQPGAEEYFRQVVNYTRELDYKHKRPITAVTNVYSSSEKCAQFLDILAINRYFSWYSDTGHTEVIREAIILEVENWVRMYKKPIMVAEYGADTIAGMHQSPDYVFTEEYQTTLMKEHFKAFDYLRANSSFIGEHIWNFADFMTAQGITRIVGNRKGIFTRERQPKASAHLLRYRFHLLAQESDGYPIPQDLLENVPVYAASRKIVHDEH